MNQIFVDCNRFNKGEINEVLLNKRNTDKTRTKVTETTLTHLSNCPGKTRPREFPGQKNKWEMRPRMC